VRRADNLTTFMCRLSSNLGTSTSWNPQGLSRPVMLIALPLPLPLLLPVQACNGIASLVMKIMNNLNLPSPESVPGLAKCGVKYQIFNRASHYCCNYFCIFTTVLQSAFHFFTRPLALQTGRLKGRCVYVMSFGLRPVIRY